MCRRRLTTKIFPFRILPRANWRKHSLMYEKNKSSINMMQVSKQSANSLIKLTHGTTINMTRSYLIGKQMTRHYFLQAIRHAIQMITNLPTTSKRNLLNHSKFYMGANQTHKPGSNFLHRLFRTTKKRHHQTFNAPIKNHVQTHLCT